MRKLTGPSPRAQFVESLESRQFLAADLAIQAASTQGLTTSAADTANITIKNTGTTTMNGKVTVSFTATPAAGGATQSLGTKQVTLSNLKANAAKGFSGLKIKAPTGTGKFNIKATISGLGDTNAANNSKSAGSVTIKTTGGNNNGGGGDGQALFGEAKVGTKLTFKKTGTLPGHGIFGFVNEQGTFKDEKGNTGTYELAIPPNLSATQPPQILNLSWKGGVQIQRSITMTFTPISKRLSNGLNGKTVTFVKSAAGTSAKGVIASGFLGTVYLKY